VKAWVLLLPLLFACCSKPVGPGVGELQAYRETYEHISGLSSRGVSIKFSALPAYYLGVCKKTDTSREIEISAESWARMSDVSREALILHEFAHCVANKEHDEKTLPDGCAASIMNPVLPDDSCLLKYRARYARELTR
jgi:hypothetical protein